MSPAQSAKVADMAPAADPTRASAVTARTTGSDSTDPDGLRMPDSITFEVADGEEEPDILAPDEVRDREHFIPITRFALMDRLTMPSAWPPGKSTQARRFFSYLD